MRETSETIILDRLQNWCEAKGIEFTEFPIDSESERDYNWMAKNWKMVNPKKPNT